MIYKTQKIRKNGPTAACPYRRNWHTVRSFLCRFLILILPGSSYVSAQIWELEENFWPLVVGLEQKDESTKLRTQYFGPFVETYRSPLVEWNTVRPFWIQYNYPQDTFDTKVNSFLYPLYVNRSGTSGSNWEILYIIRGSRSTESEREDGKRFEIFPFYYDHRYPLEYDSYWGIFPIYGEVKNRLFLDRLSWILFPLYSKWERDDQITYATPWPFIQYRTGGGSRGYALWPLFGVYERPDDYYNRFFIWPLIYDYRKNLDQDVPKRNLGFLPFYTRDTDEGYIAETYIWPFFGYTDRDDPYYSEIRYFWPFFVQGRGTPYVNRWAPIYTHSIRQGIDKKWWMWPLFKKTSYDTEELKVDTWSFFYLLWWQMDQYALDEDVGFHARKVYSWPLLSDWDDGAGRRQFQLFSPLEPWFKGSQIIRDLYSPLFAIYRYDGDSNEESWRHSLLFNLLSLEKTPEKRRFTIGPVLDVQTGKTGKFSLLHGLFERKRTKDEVNYRLLWFRI